MEVENVIFLDIDGVLCLASTGGLYALPGQKKFHQPSVDQLKEVVDQSKAVLVMSSSWRLKSKEVQH